MMKGVHLKVVLNIYICDDNSEFLSKIEKRIRNYILIQGLPMTMACATTSPNDMLHSLKQCREGVGPFGAYFLDIHLENSIDGINLAEAVRLYDSRGFIIFITMDPDFLPITLLKRLEILDYIVKGESDLEEKICRCIDSIYARITNIESPQTGKFVFNLTDDLKGMTVSVNLPDILYFQSSADMPHNIALYTHSHRYVFRGSLNKTIDALDEHFFRCHKSVIVNLNKITGLDKKSLIAQIANDHEVFVASRSFGKLKRLLEWD